MVEVTYHCPRCGALAALDRDAYLADKCVTPTPLDGWAYVPAYELVGEGTVDDALDGADGVELVCGASETDGEGCGEPYYLSFVKFERGEAVEPRGRGPGGRR
ncbi:MAG: hypothetical protein ABEJ23_04170 [Haloarculaceae archaeon]